MEYQNFDGTTNTNTCGVFSPQSDCSYDSGFSGGIMDQTAEMNGEFMSSFVNEFTCYNQHQAQVSITCPPQYLSLNQQEPIAFNPIWSPSTSTMEAKPYLEIVEEPTDKPFRFRYKSEMHGTHGSLMGLSNKKNKRTFPTVALRNFNFPMKAYIYCSLYQVESAGKLKRSPHSHKLVIRKGDREELDPHKIEVSDLNNFTATFQGMGIIHTAKKNIKEELFRKMREELDIEVKRNLTPNEIAAFQRDAEKQSKEMNLNQVCLCFQAFVKNEVDNSMVKICEPIYSRVINNMKSALTGELRITRMSKDWSSVAGGEEIFMFVEKVCKNNIKVRFYESCNDVIIWERFGVFNESDVHHQYGIVLRTPPYDKTNIESTVVVKVQLFRPSDGTTSDSLEFRYKPNIQNRYKRPRTDSGELIPTVLDSHNSATPRTFRDKGPSQSCSNDNSFGGQSSNNNQQNFDDSLFNNDSKWFGQFFATITPSTLNFSYNDLNDLPSSPEELCSLLDIEVGGESMLQIDSVCVEKPHAQRTSELRCPLIDKLRALIRLFKNNFDGDKLRDMINVLVEQQAETGENILLDLIQHGSVQEIKELVIILVKFRLNDVLHSLNDLDQNCLHVLVLGAHYKLLKIFLSLGVDANQADAFGDTPLHLAVASGDEKLVKELLEGADNLELNKINDKGQAPLHLAVSQNDLAITKQLVERGADLFKKIPLSGNNVLHLAVSKTDVSVSLVTFLIERDEKLLNEENNAGMNALQIAASAKQPENLIKHLAQCYDESYTFAAGNDDDESTSESEDEEIFSKLFDAQCFKKLCKIFNSSEKWKNVLIIAEEEAKIDLWQDESNPARNLLFHLESEGRNIDDFLEFFDLLDEDQATVAVNDMLARKFGE